MFKTVQQFWQEVQLQRLRNYEMVIGKQWKKEDYDYLVNNRRSADVFNFILPIILALSGTEKVNRQKMRAYPIGGGDEDLAQMVTQIMRWSFDKCDKPFQTSRAFMDAVIARIGWMKSYWSTEWDVEGLWYTDWHDPLRILIDPETQGDFHRTCNYLFDSTWLPGEALVNLYGSNNPDLADRMQEQLRILEGNTPGGQKTLSWRDKAHLMLNVARAAFGREKQLTEILETEWLDVRNGMYRVVELHEKRRERHKYFMDTISGRTMMIPDDVQDNREVIGQMLERNTQLMVLTKYDTVNYVSTLIPAFSSDPVAAVPQDKPYDIQNGQYAYTPITCFDFHPDIAESRSLVDALIDPQMAYNKMESTLKDYIIRFVGHGWIIEDGAIPPDHLADWESRTVGVNRTYKAGSKRPEADIPPDARQVFVAKSDHRESLRAISAVPLNFQGETQTSNEAASLFTQRVQQAGLIQSTYLDALKRADRYLGKWAIDGMQHFIKGERTIRITQDESDPWWLTVNQKTLNGLENDLSIGKYDVELDASSYSVTAKQEAFVQGVTLAKMMPPELIPWHLIIANSDIPNKREWMQFIQQRMQIAGAGGVDPRLAANGMLQQLMAANNGRGRIAASGVTDGERVSPLAS